MALPCDRFAHRGDGLAGGEDEERTDPDQQDGCFGGGMHQRAIGYLDLASVSWEENGVEAWLGLTCGAWVPLIGARRLCRELVSP